MNVDKRINMQLKRNQEAVAEKMEEITQIKEQHSQQSSSEAPTDLEKAQEAQIADLTQKLETLKEQMEIVEQEKADHVTKSERMKALRQTKAGHC